MIVHSHLHNAPLQAALHAGWSCESRIRASVSVLPIGLSVAAHCSIAGPLAVASLRANHAIAGTEDSAGYHAVNVGLHSGCAALVLLVFQHWLPLSTRYLAPLAINFDLTNSDCHCSCLAALLFALHPVHTEAVASVTVITCLACHASFACVSVLCYRVGQMCYVLPSRSVQLWYVRSGWEIG